MSPNSPTATGRTIPIANVLTWVLAALTLLFLPLRLLMEGDIAPALYNTFYIYGTVLQITFAVVILVIAARLGLHESVGRQWGLIGVGVACYALGDILWTVYELFLGIDPYPSIADIFYTAEYVFFLAAIVLAVRAYSGLVKTRIPVLVGGVLAVVGITAVYLLLLKPYIFPDSAGWELVVSTLYPVGDVAFMLAPAVTLALVVRQLGAGIFARPWWIVVVGALVFAVTDAFYSYADWAGLGTTPALDMGWMVANLLFACAALVAWRTFKTR